MSKTTWYLLGWILGAAFGVSLELGNQSNWSTVGLLFCVVAVSFLSLVVFAICADVHGEK